MSNAYVDINFVELYFVNKFDVNNAVLDLKRTYSNVNKLRYLSYKQSSVQQNCIDILFLI